MKKLIFSSFCALALISFLPDNTLTGKFVPEGGKRLLFIGQDMSATGGFSGVNGDGYMEHVRSDMAGITFYTNLPTLGGLYETVNYGGGDGCAQYYLDSKKFDNVAFSIGLYMVDQEQAIAEGKQDRAIKGLARWIKYSKRPCFLRIGYEFDGAWNHYDPEYYVKAYRRIVDKFEEFGVTNCAYVWQACTSPIDDIIDGGHEDINRFYPGDDYVDWFGYSWFVNTPKQYELTDEIVEMARVHHKPVMVCESASQGYDHARGTKKYLASIFDGPSGTGAVAKSGQQIWKEWFDPFFKYIDENDDVIRSVAYINCNWDAQPMWGPPYNQGYWGDTRVEANDYVLQQWQDEINQPYWLHNSETMNQQIGFSSKKK